MLLKDIKNDYMTGNIEKTEYLEKMFRRYEELFEYKELIKNTTVSKITINDDEVCITIKNLDYKNEVYSIDMIIYQDDIGAVPAIALNFSEGYEPEELRMVTKLCSYLSAGAVVFDIGANLGWYSLNLSKQHSDFFIYAFEPIKETFVKLNKNLDINNIKNCKTYNIGLSNKKGIETFYYDVTVSGASSMVDLREKGNVKKVKCNLETIDEFFYINNIKQVDFIKCDVEGAELFVYQGGERIIKEYKPIVFSEMLRKWSAKFGYHPNDIILFFKELGYKCFVIDKQGYLKEINEVNEGTIETNYFFLNIEKHYNIISDLCIAE